MKIFASWSGDPSRQVAELVRDWLPNVIQEADVYVSSQDISKGERWSINLWDRLSEIDFGVICVTRGNHTAPWIMFESGALSKSIKSRVIPILCDLTQIDVSQTPLNQFQCANVTEEDFRPVVFSINSVCEKPLDDARLKRAFDMWWPEFITRFQKIDFFTDQPKETGKRSDAARLDKIEAALDSVLSQLSRLGRQLGSRPPVPNPTVPFGLLGGVPPAPVAEPNPEEFARWFAGETAKGGTRVSVEKIMKTIDEIKNRGESSDS